MQNTSPKAIFGAILKKRSDSKARRPKRRFWQIGQRPFLVRVLLRRWQHRRIHRFKKRFEIFFDASSVEGVQLLHHAFEVLNRRHWFPSVVSQLKLKVLDDPLKVWFLPRPSRLQGPITIYSNQNGLQATSEFEMCFCYVYRIPAPNVPGVPIRTRLESRFCIIRNLNPI